MVGTADSVLSREVPSSQSVLYGELVLYCSEHWGTPNLKACLHLQTFERCSHILHITSHRASASESCNGHFGRVMKQQPYTFLHEAERYARTYVCI